MDALLQSLPAVPASSVNSLRMGKSDSHGGGSRLGRKLTNVQLPLVFRSHSFHLDLENGSDPDDSEHNLVRDRSSFVNRLCMSTLKNNHPYPATASKRWLSESEGCN
jgi:hypothetical protein